MVSDYVMNQNDCQGRREADDSVGLGAYNMDSHHVQRYVDEKGDVRNEGDVQVGVSPYAISYRSIVPRQAECNNLFVPVCLAASHIAYGSIRMEPVFMVLGQSSATAACQSIDDEVPVQKVSYERLAKKLLEDGQVLKWTGPRRAAVQSIDPKKLPGIVVDDDKAEIVGQWGTSMSVGGFVGAGYLHDENEGKGQKRVIFRVTLKEPGEYEVRAAYTPNPNRATNVPVVIQHAGGTAKVTINEQKTPPIDKTFVSLGKFKFDKTAEIVFSNDGTKGHVIVDAVQLLPAK
jgi:hypothetical protein